MSLIIYQIFHNTRSVCTCSTFSLYTLDLFDSFDKFSFIEVWLLSFLLSILGSKLKQEDSKQSHVNELFTRCLQAHRDDVEHSNESQDEISQILFVATEVGNVEFLVKLIHFDVDLLWKTQNNKSIFCIAVEKRHERIFNLINEIGSIGELLIDQVEEDGTNILHLAAGLAPQEKLNAISGAALQMQREFLWFKVYTYLYML